jgi:xanthine dehydrogenase small subunit
MSAIDGNICRCTGYKSIERAASELSKRLAVSCEQPDGNRAEAKMEIVPEYFQGIKQKLSEISEPKNSLPLTANGSHFLGGGTDLYVQKHEEMVYANSESLFDNSDLRFIRETVEFVEIGASTVVTDLLESPIMNRLFPNLYKHLKLVSSTPIRNMATLAGNFVNASPIGDMTAWFLALDAEIELRTLENKGGSPRVSKGAIRTIPLKDFYLGYKQLAKSEQEIITKIRFRKDFTHFNFEKVSKRTYLDIASVNTAISLRVSSPTVREGFNPDERNSAANAEARAHARATDTPTIFEAHVSAGGVSPIPMYLFKTSEFLRGKEINETTISKANEIIQSEISPISDVRGSAEYKRLLLRQLFTAHFVELFDVNIQSDF